MFLRTWEAGQPGELDFVEFRQGLRHKARMKKALAGDVVLARLWREANVLREPNVSLENIAAMLCSVGGLETQRQTGGGKKVLGGSRKMPGTTKALASMPKPDGSPSRLLLCHVCLGRFSLTSLARHLPNCSAKWTRQMCEALPPTLRVSLQVVNAPLPPQGCSQSMVNAYNVAAEHAHKISMPRCPECDQSFVPDRLLRHMRKCCLGRFEATASAMSATTSS